MNANELSRREFVTRAAALGLGGAMVPAVFTGEGQAAGLTKEVLPLGESEGAMCAKEPTDLMPKEVQDKLQEMFDRALARKTFAHDTMYVVRELYGLQLIDQRALAAERDKAYNEARMLPPHYNFPTDLVNGDQNWVVLRTKAYECHRDDLEGLDMLMHESYADFMGQLHQHLKENPNKYRFMDAPWFSNKELAYGFTKADRREAQQHPHLDVAWNEVPPLEDPEHPVNDTDIVSWCVFAVLTEHDFPKHLHYTEPLPITTIAICAERMQKYVQTVQHRKLPEFREALALLPELAQHWQKQLTHKNLFLVEPPLLAGNNSDEVRRNLRGCWSSFKQTVVGRVDNEDLRQQFQADLIKTMHDMASYLRAENLEEGERAYITALPWVVPTGPDVQIENLSEADCEVLKHPNSVCCDVIWIWKDGPQDKQRGLRYRDAPTASEFRWMAHEVLLRIRDAHRTEHMCRSTYGKEVDDRWNQVRSLI